MENFLLFRLYGPMASWGEIAVGEVRRSATYPSRSAILGLVSAALGIKRDETKKLTDIFNGYDVAVKVESMGTLLKDFHTIQVPKSAKNKKYSTRLDELAFAKNKDKTATILSTREYRCDALSIVALRSRSNPPYSLEKIQEKLFKPEFILYLGRKSCPLALPLKPQILRATGFKEALDKSSFPPIITTKDNGNSTSKFLPIKTASYYWENDAKDMKPQWTNERCDEPLNRERWQFGTREEHLMSLGGGQ